MKAVEDRLREWIDRDTQALEARGVDHLRGHDWFQVSYEEQDVFGLDPNTVARVIVVHEAYQAIADIAHNGLHGTPLCKEARAAFPWIEPGRSDLGTFQRFARLFDVSYRQAHAFYWKHDFWQIRQGITRFKDESDEEKDRALSAAEPWPADHPRLRGLYPETGPVGRLDPQVLATISLDADLYEWMKGFVGKNSFTFCVEEAIHTVLRCMRGNETTMNLDALAGFVAGERGTTPVEAVFGGIQDKDVHGAAALFYDAARIATARHADSDFFDLLLPDDDDGRKRVLELLRIVLPDWDPIRQIADDRAAEEKWLEEHGEELHAEAEKADHPDRERKKGDDFDDDIPF